MTRAGIAVPITSLFRQRLRSIRPREGTRRWLYVPYDQLSDQIGPLSQGAPSDLGIILIESPWKASLRPYHKQKLALILANQRHFALEQAQRGIAVRYLLSEGPFRFALREQIEELGPIDVMVPAERELRVDLEPLVRGGGLRCLPHEGWLTTEEDFDASHPRGGPFRMDRFYKWVRRRTGILMEGRSPEGGKFSFDGENRHAWSGDPPAPSPPQFPPDDIVEEVCRIVDERFSDHPGTIDRSSIPATKTHAVELWDWARAECLTLFGPYQDAMSSQSSSLFHTRISALLHLHRLLPRDVVRETLELDIPIASKEGFVRQVLGWREFVRHIHRASDGFRSLDKVVGEPPQSKNDASERLEESPFDGGARPSFLKADNRLPPAYWGKKSGLECLDRVVAEVWREGYGHHITRLMVLANLGTLLDISPRELTDWFWVAYADAYDWVVEPNVLGMGTFAVGDWMTTKPYVAGSAYISRMSDYCRSCRFDPKKTCPIRRLYWAFLERHRDALDSNPRMRVPLTSLRKRSDREKEEDRKTFANTLERLQAGEELTWNPAKTSPQGDFR